MGLDVESKSTLDEVIDRAQTALTNAITQAFNSLAADEDKAAVIISNLLTGFDGWTLTLSKPQTKK